jgi:hypothetical protein
MKRLFFVLAAAMAIASCNESDKKAEGSSATAANASISQDSLDKLNQLSKAANQQEASPATSVAPTDASQTTIEWLDGTNRNFGTMKQGETLNVTFRFKNTGTRPLIISDVTAGCGCTIPEKPKEPFAPGQTGEIKASFDSNRGQVGTNSKSVNVFANVNPPMTTLNFSVEVKPKS